MSEIFSAIRLKDRIIIGIVLSVYAILLAGSAGAITYATANNHIHSYDNYVFERDAAGDFRFVGTCTRVNCRNPYDYILSDEFDVFEKVIKAPTCTEDGEKAYYAELIIRGEKVGFTYSETEKIPATNHAYAHDGAIDPEAGTVTLNCVNEGCTVGDLVINTNDIKLESTTKGTCSAPQQDKYSYTVNGVSGSFTAIYEVDQASHVLGGVPAVDYLAPYKIGENTYNYEYLHETEGIVIPVDVKPGGCGWKVPGFYQCEGCNTTITIMIGLPDHSYSPVEGSLTKATFDNIGQISLKCQNKDCTDASKKVTLPKAVAGTNTTLLDTDEEKVQQTWKYSQYLERYNCTVEYEFVSEWIHDHVYVYDRVTKAPTVDADGEFAVKCSLCREEKLHSIPKATEQNADEIISATEQTPLIYVYIYVSEQFDFTEVFEVEAGPVLSHDFQYELISYNGGFALRRTCNQPGCQEPSAITDEGIIPEHESVAPTCSKPGYEQWTYIKDGKACTPIRIELPADSVKHTFLYDRANTVYPSADSEGTTVLSCYADGCSEVTDVIVLPKIVVGQNAYIVPETGTLIYSFKFTYNGKDYESSIEFPNYAEHAHSYSYELVPMMGGLIGKFNLVGECTYPLCTEKNVINDVPAVMERDETDCAEGIRQIWSYTLDGETYTCTLNLNIGVPESHNMEYSADAPTTVNPTLDKSGYIKVYCTKCSRAFDVELPPIFDPSVDAKVIGESEDYLSYRYIYNYVYDESDPNGSVTIELTILVSLINK